MQTVRCAKKSKKERLGGELGVATRWDKEMPKTYSWGTVSLLMAFIAMVGFALPALGDDWHPFKGYGDEILSSGDTVDNDCLKGCDVTAMGAGWATHLDHFTRMSCAAPNPNGNGHIVGTTEFTAANGDTLCAEVDVEPLEDNIVRGTYRFVSGTGRFSDVSGEANFVGVTTSDRSNNVHVIVDFLGTIRY